MATNLSATIEQVLRVAASQITAVVRGELARQVSQLLVDEYQPRRSRGGRLTKRHVPSTCIASRCRNASKGPRFSFLCDDHKGIAKSERRVLLAKWKKRQVSKKGPRAVSHRGQKKGR